MLYSIMPKVLAETVVMYADEQEKKPKDIESEIEATQYVEPTLSETEPAFITNQELTSSDEKILEQSNSNQMVKIVVKPSSDTAEAISYLLTPLMIAAGKGHPVALRRLLDKGADPTVSIRGNTAFIWALHGKRTGHQEAAKILLESVEPIATTTDSDACAIA